MNRPPRLLAVVGVCLVFVMLAGCGNNGSGSPKTGSVIFIHPDGASAAHFAALRVWHVGPDGELNWDKLPAIAVYRDHASDSLTVTSNAGGTMHAHGVKAPRRSFGTDGDNPIVDAQGRSTSVMHQAMRAGMPVGVVNSGINTEPGTACFLASVPSRKMHDEISLQMVESGADVILGGGESLFLPEGAQGRHGVGKRKDGKNLVELAKQHGYTIVYTREQLTALPDNTDKVLGLFAEHHTFNDRPEEVLRERGLKPYNADAPTVAEMTRAALKVLSRKGKPFMLVVEEEGTDNFSNHNNAMGTLQALKRSDETIGVARAYLAQHRNTLVVVAADSNAGGMLHIGLGDDKSAAPATVNAKDRNGAPRDGIDGENTPPFTAKPDKAGRVMKFAVMWATRSDGSGGVLVRADGLNRDRVAGSFDNTDITRLIRLTLFGDGAYDG